MTENTDVIIIGSEAGGGTLAHAVAGSGKRFMAKSQILVVGASQG